MRRNARAKAKSSNLPSLCHSMFEGSPLATATVEGAMHALCFVNSAFCHLVGKNKAELTGKPFGEIVPEDGLLSQLDHVYRTGEAKSYPEPEHSEAHPVYWSYAMWPVLGADQHPVGLMIQMTETPYLHQQAIAMNQELLLSGLRQHELIEMADKLNAQLQVEIADRKRMEQALLDGEKLAVTARFALTMAHEINTPLAAMTNLLFLLAPLQVSPDAQAYMAVLEEQLKGLARIATQMLKFHRDSNRPAEFKLSEVLCHASETYGHRAAAQGVVVKKRVETEGIISGFSSEIVQVISNLLLNAIDATPAGGQVNVHLYPAPPWLCDLHNLCGYCISVADTGSGIEPQHRARIFEPFFTTKGDKGTGLGLWVCRGIVNRVGGSIRVWSSRRSGRTGTCFSVFLPCGGSSVYTASPQIRAVPSGWLILQQWGGILHSSR